VAVFTGLLPDFFPKQPFLGLPIPRVLLVPPTAVGSAVPDRCTTMTDSLPD